MSDMTTRGEKKIMKYTEIVAMARKGELTLISESYPVEFVRYFEQLHSISEKLAMPAEQQVPNDETKVRRCLDFGSDTDPVCVSCGIILKQTTGCYFTTDLDETHLVRIKSHCMRCFNIHRSSK